MTKSERVKPAGWIVVEPRDRKFQRPLGFDPDEKTVGTYFGAIYYQHKYAKEAAAQWKDARIVRVRLEEV